MVRKEIFYGSFIGEVEAPFSEHFMYVKMRMFNDKVNRNNMRLTAEFIRNIADNKKDYIGLPLFADANRLKIGSKRNLGHMMDKAGVFHSEMIGSFYDFELVEAEEHVELIGYLKIAKRNKTLCETIVSLFDEESLNVSYEISAQDVIEEDGIIVVPASENNVLMGMAVVSIPAIPDSTALALVAEADMWQLRDKAWRAVKNKIESDFKTDCYFEPIYVGLEETVFFNCETKELYKATYKIEDDGLKELNIFECELKRKGEETPMAEVKTPAVAEVIEPTVEPTEVEILKSEIEILKEEIKALKEIESKYNALVEEQEKAIREAKTKELKGFAEKMGLNVEEEEIKEAIEALNYEVLVKKASEKEVSAPAPIVASYTDMKLETAYGSILDRA